MSLANRLECPCKALPQARDEVDERVAECYCSGLASACGWWGAAALCVRWTHVLRGPKRSVDPVARGSRRPSRRRDSDGVHSTPSPFRETRGFKASTGGREKTGTEQCSVPVLFVLLRMVGLEPTRCHHREILSLVRLPIPPHPHSLRRVVATQTILPPF